MTFATHDHGTKRVICLTGRLDAHGARGLQAYLDSLDYGEAEELSLDLAEVPYLSSAGLRVLLMAKQYCETREIRFSLANVAPYCLEVLRISGLHQAFFLSQSVDNSPHEFTKHSGVFRTHAGSDDCGTIEVLGRIEDVLAARIRAEDVKSKRFSAKEFSIGLGALGASIAEALPLLGEMMTIGGTMVWLPTDGNDTPDYLIPHAESTTVLIRTGFNASIAGEFNDFVDFRSAHEEGSTLEDIYTSLFQIARARRPDFRGAIALAMRADVAAVYGAGVIKAPIAANAPSNGEWIIHPTNFPDWFEFDDVPRHGALTGLICGVGLDLTADLSVYNKQCMEDSFYVNPANVGSSQVMLHNHGAFFTPMVFPDPPRSLEEEIAAVVEVGDFSDMRHLLDRTRITRALIGVVYVQDFCPDPGDAE